jgi:hypothetical protein
MKPNPESAKIPDEGMEIMRGSISDFSSLLHSYENEIPIDILSGECTHKCQVNWINMVHGKVSVLKEQLNRRGMYPASLALHINNLITHLNELIIRNTISKRFGAIYLTTDNDIQKSDELIQAVLDELTFLIEYGYME